ncbi:DUF992 domain-containing protein [Terrihabitans sp. B22-R8]|uniref:DUF992 domain-containing protein n=1 Tax=Terrihabitans sp. B22-R8 TaxID=3425128 RepID=UPI00403C495E
MKKLVFAAALGGLLLPMAPAHSATEAGLLECDVSGGVGLIVGSTKAMSCRYTSADGKITEPYSGEISKVGVDIGVTGKSVMVWTVLAPTDTLRPGALEGTYAGVSGQATVGVGASANVLVGGSDRTISLQPLSVGMQTGLNVAAGIGSITLRSPTR